MALEVPQGSYVAAREPQQSSDQTARTSRIYLSWSLKHSLLCISAHITMVINKYTYELCPAAEMDQRQYFD